MGALTEFFTPEAGQARTAWKNDVLTRAGNALNYYLGPTGIPDKINALAQALEFTDAGDYKFAAEASRDLWNNPSVANAANYATAGAALAIPFVGAKMATEGVDVAGDAVRSFLDDVQRYFGDEAGSVGLADDVTQRGQTILDLLGSGRASEVTDDMLDMGDATKNARLNEYLFNNYDLPMDEASRMARAREMGLRPGWYRGALSDTASFNENPTGRNFVSFGPPEGSEITRSGTFFSDNPAYANEYAATMTNNGNVVRPSGAVVGSYNVPRTQPLPDPYSIKQWAEDVGDDAAYEEMRWSGGGWEMLDDEAGQAVKRYAGAQPNFRGAYEFEEYIPSYFKDEEISGNTAVVFDPRNIRSRFARFDPRLAHLRNLLAGVTGGGFVAANALTQNGEQQ